MSANYAFGIAAMLCGSLLGACGREDARNVSPTVQDYSRKAERQVERGAAVLDDATITAKVKTALIAAPEVKGLAIDVDTSGNVVSLNGSVSTEQLRKRAEQIAAQVEGVKEVKNNLAVKAAP